MSVATTDAASRLPADRSGVSAPMLSQVERGDTSPTLAVATRIAFGLELSLSQLLRLDEGDTLAVERERDLALSNQARQAVEEIDHALAKFDLGTYGICEVSGEPIPRERLEAIPWARERVEYKVGGLGRR